MMDTQKLYLLVLFLCMTVKLISRWFTKLTKKNGELKLKNII